jgi:hypothetical protein
MAKITKRVENQIRRILREEHPNAKSIDVFDGEAEVIHLVSRPTRIGKLTTPHVTTRHYYVYGPDNAKEFGFEDACADDPTYLNLLINEETLYDGMPQDSDEFWDHFIACPQDHWLEPIRMYRKPVQKIKKESTKKNVRRNNNKKKSPRGE